MPDPFYTEGSETSREAAEDLTEREGHARQILQFAYDRGRDGITADEVAVMLNIETGRASPRVSELSEINAGVLVKAGEQRPTRCFRKAEVYVLAEGLSVEEALLRYNMWCSGPLRQILSNRSKRSKLYKIALQYADIWQDPESSVLEKSEAGQSLLDFAKTIRE